MGLKNRKLDNCIYNHFSDNGLHFGALTDNHITKVNMIRFSNLRAVKANQTQAHQFVGKDIQKKHKFSCKLKKIPRFCVTGKICKVTVC